MDSGHNAALPKVASRIRNRCDSRIEALPGQLEFINSSVLANLEKITIRLTWRADQYHQNDKSADKRLLHFCKSKFKVKTDFVISMANGDNAVKVQKESTLTLMILKNNMHLKVPIVNCAKGNNILDEIIIFFSSMSTWSSECFGSMTDEVCLAYSSDESSICILYTLTFPSFFWLQEFLFELENENSIPTNTRTVKGNNRFPVIVITLP
jgi:hypothetical protein